MILIDSSIWIEYFKKDSKIVNKLDELLDTNERIATTGVIEQEVLQGLSSPKIIKHISEIFDNMVYLPLSDRSLFRKAANLYRFMRKKGITIRSSIDCLIAVLCIKHSIPVWHKDRDFDYIQKYTKLEIFKP